MNQPIFAPGTKKTLARLEEKADRILALLERLDDPPPHEEERPAAPADIFSEWMLGRP